MHFHSPYLQQAFLICLLICNFFLAHAQDTLRLSLEDAIQSAQIQSPITRSTKLDMIAARWDYQAFQASLKPQISMNANIPGFSRSITEISQDDGSSLFRTQSRAFSDIGLNIQQQIPLTGGSVFFSSSINSLFNFEPIDNRLWQTNPLLITLIQPIFQINTIKWDKQQEALRYQLAEISYLAALEDISINITQIYFDALTAQTNRDRAQLNVSNNDTIYRISEGRFSVGNIAENELLQSELSLMSARSELEQATLDYEQAVRQLRIELGLERDLPIRLVLPNNLPDSEIDVDLAIEEAMRNGEFTASARLQRFNANRNVAVAKNANNFQADLRATFGLNQSAENLSDAFNNQLDRQFFSVGIDVPIFNWGRAKAENNAAIARQESLNESLELAQQNFENDVYFQVMSIRQLDRQLEISAKSEDIALRRYDISRNRYLIGKISIQDLFIAQQEKDNAQQRYISDLRRFWTAWLGLRRITLYDFEKQEPLRISEEFRNQVGR